MSKILIVEDEPRLNNFLEQALIQKGQSVLNACDGQQGLYFAKECEVDLAVIDLGLPIISGLELIKKIREQKKFPIIIVTARGQWYDKVEGLTLGADDYIVKPFHIEELWARITVLLRRESDNRKDILDYGPIHLSLMKQRVFVNNSELILTPYEYKIFEYFMLHPKRLITKTELVDHLYDEEFEHDSNVIEVLMGRLRKKIKCFYLGAVFKTYRARGYMLEI